MRGAGPTEVLMAAMVSEEIIQTNQSYQGGVRSKRTLTPPSPGVPGEGVRENTGGTLVLLFSLLLIVFALEVLGFFLEIGEEAHDATLLFGLELGSIQPFGGPRG